MWRRTVLVMLACLGAGAVVGLVPTTALAAPSQAAPTSCDTGDYPPTGPAIEPGLMITGAHLLPGTATGTLTLSGAAPGGSYHGTLYAPAVALPPTTAATNGGVSFTNLTIPAGFALVARHHLDIYRDCGLVGTYDFCVNAQGGITAATTCAGAAAAAGKLPASGSLPRTGWDHLAEIVKVAVLVIALGVYLRYLQRRRALRALA